MPHRSFRSIAAGLTATFLLQACGGGSTTLTPQPRSTATSSAPVAGTTRQSGTVVLPPGVSVAPSALTVTNSVAKATPSANGSFALIAYSGGPQFTLVSDAQGNPVLAGFLGPNSTTLDSLSTAKLFAYFAAALYSLPSPYREQMVDAIATAPGFGAVQNAIVAALQSNPAGLASNQGVTSALTTFVTALYAPANPSNAARLLREAAAARGRLDVLVQPSTAQSGITTINDFPDGVHFMNTYRRAAEAFFDQDSYVDQDGTRIPMPVQDVTAPQQIPAVSGLGNVTSSLVGAVQGLFSGATQYTPTSTASTPLSNLANASSTRYIVTVVGAGATNTSVSLRQEESDAQKLLVVQQLIQDFVVPIVASIVIPLNSSAIDNSLNFDGGNAAFADLITTLTTAAPQIYTLENSGQVSDALALAFTTVYSSNTVQAAFLQFFQNAIAEGSGLEAQAFFQQGSALLNKLNVLSGTLVGADVAVVATNIASSHDADQFVVDVNADKVTLTPASATLSNGGTQGFTGNVPGAGGSGASFVWQWANTATVGHITDGMSGHVDNFTSSSNTVTYTANATGTGSDTITLTAFEIQGSNRVQVGTPQTATVTVQSNPICNGDFSQGFQCWNQTVVSTGSFSGYPKFEINSGEACLATSGNPYFSMDVPGGAEGVLSQTFTVPAGSPTLYMYTWGNLDPVNVNIEITPAAGSPAVIGSFTPPQIENSETTCSGAVPIVESFSLASYAGQTVTLGIDATSGGYDGTIAQFDDIGFSAPPASYARPRASARR
jgi:hypothetical protein